jgi:exonuclease III
MIKIAAQNVAGSHLGFNKKGGGLVKIRLLINAHKPTIFAITETRIDNPEADLNKTYRIYKCQQHSSSGTQTKRVVIWYKKGVEIIGATVYNDRDGHCTLAVYLIEGSKYIVEGMYGPSQGSDRISKEKYEEVFRRIGRIRQMHRTRNIIMLGDFNI